MKQLQEKLNAANNKYFEVKNANTQLKNDLKIANKLLQQEVGDSLENLQQNAAGWRGRSQIICDLQQKNADLKEKVQTLQNKAPSKDHENLIKATGRIDGLSRENSDLKRDLQEVRRKMETLKARCKVLENDCSLHKIKLANTLEHRERDQEMLNNLSVRVFPFFC